MPPPRHPPQRSNIRTRSQQQQPILPADLAASPLKAIRRQNQIATVVQNVQTSITPEPQCEQEPEESDIPLANGKRSPPVFAPSSPSRLHDWKRQRVFTEKDEEKTESAASSQTTSTNCPSTPTSSQGPFPREPVHLNLARISQSPPKPVASPMRMFKITTQTGGTVEVPVTPARRPTLNPENMTKSNQAQLQIDNAEILPHATPAHALDITDDTVHPPPSSCLQPAFDLNATSSTSDVIHPAVSSSEAPDISALDSTGKPELVLSFKTPVKPQETPAPGPSRLPKPSSSFRISSLPDNIIKTPTRVSNPMAATISSLAKAKPRISPMRLRSRPQLKAKLGIKDRTPASKLALKRTMRRTSLNKGKIKGVTLPSVNPPGVAADAVDKSIKGSKQTTIKSFFQQRPTSTKQPLPVMGSPSKPAPLVALSTALKKLEVSAPLPPTRPAVSSGSTESTNAPPTRDEPEKTQEDTSGAAKSNIVVTGSPKMTPKAHLPMRLPSNPDINGRSILPVNKSPIKNSLTLTNPSSTESSETQDKLPNGKSIPNPSEIVDVESWLDKTAEEQKENKLPLEFLVPLADEPSTSMKPLALAQISPSRRASQASLALSQSLSVPNRPQIFPQVRSVSTSHLQLNARSPVKTRGKTKPQAPATEAANQTTGKRSNARMPGSLDVLKDCVIFVDVKTEEGEDAAPLFVDMLRGLGARILSKPGKSCTHLVFKAGLPSTVVKYKLLPQPKPLVVSIGWVVECVEKRSHVDEMRFLVNLDDFDVTGGSLRRRSLTMQPKQIRALILGQLDPGDSGDSGTNGGDASFTSEGSSAAANLSPPQRTAVTDNLPPLERARQRSQRFFRKK